MQVQNNVLEQLLAAHHPNKSFLEKNSNHYYYERFSLGRNTGRPGALSEPFQHSHDAYEFLIPYGPIPMLMCEGSVFFGEVGYVYPVQSQKVHAFRFRAAGVSYDSIVVEKLYGRTDEENFFMVSVNSVEKCRCVKSLVSTYPYLKKCMPAVLQKI